MKEGEGEGFSFLSSPPSPRLLTLFFAQSLLRGLWLSKQLGNACYAGYFQPFASSAVACSRLSDSGKGTNEWGRCERERHAKGGGGAGAGKKGKKKFPPVFLSFLRFLNCADPLLSRSLEQASSAAECVLLPEADRGREGWVERSSMNSLTWRCPCIFDQLPRTLHCQVSRTWRKWGTLSQGEKR